MNLKALLPMIFIFGTSLIAKEVESKWADRVHSYIFSPTLTNPFPNPKQWESLKIVLQEIDESKMSKKEKLKKHLLQLFSNYLNNDKDLFFKNIQDLYNNKEAQRTHYSLKYIFKAYLLNNNEDIKKYFPSYVELITSSKYYYDYLDVTNFISIFGKKEATKHLKKLLNKELNISLNFKCNDGTKKLVVEIFEENPSDKKIPKNIVAHKGFEYLFPKLEEKDKKQIYLLYCNYLIESNQVDKAVTVVENYATKNKPLSLYYLSKKVASPSIKENYYSFLKKIYPKYKFNSQLLIKLNIQLNKDKSELLDLVNNKYETLDNTNSSEKILEKINIYLAYHKLESVTQLISETLNSSMFSDTKMENKEKVNALYKFIQFAQVTSNTTLFNRSLEYYKAIGQKNESANQLDILRNLIKLKLYEDANQIINSHLEKVKKDNPQSLLMIYVQTKQYQKALALIKSKEWENNAKEIQRLVNGSKTSVGYLMAKTFLSTNQQEKAIQTLEITMTVLGGNDRAYELYNKIKKKEAIKFYKKLSEFNPFEERPLIWIAHLLEQNNQLELAEQYALKAIEVDPSDGEQGKNDRMRVYSVMANIYNKRAERNNIDKEKYIKKATFFTNVVQSIRLSENADDLYSAGLTLQAIEKYNDALNLFSDAYCIQSRLALRHWQLGNKKLALKHYKKAYQLMPDSFGLIESHCFGCEGVFQGKETQSLAEKIFLSHIEKYPNKPQAYYLLGYLHSTKEEYTKAIEYYQKAIDINPNYFNAIKKLVDIQKNSNLSIEQQDDNIIKLVKLQPLKLNNYYYSYINNIQNLKKLWVVVKNKYDSNKGFLSNHIDGMTTDAVFNKLVIISNFKSLLKSNN